MNNSNTLNHRIFGSTLYHACQEEIPEYLIVSHAADLDGVAAALTYATALKASHFGFAKVVFVDYHNAREILESELAARASAPYEYVIVSDISIRDQSWLDFIMPAIERGTNFEFIDHHVDSRECFEAWTALGMPELKCILDASGKSCATDLVYRHVGSEDYYVGLLPVANLQDTFASLQTLVSAAHSIDLWLLDDLNGLYLSDVVTVLGAERAFELLYEDLSRADYANFTDEMREAHLTAESDRHDNLIAAKLSSKGGCYRADDEHLLHITVASVNGQESYVGSELCGDYPYALVVLIQETRNTYSFRCSKRCGEIGIYANAIAREFGGGGHPCAAGAPAEPEMTPSNLLPKVFEIVKGLIDAR